MHHPLRSLLAISVLAAPALAQSTVQIQASADNTLFEDVNGALSNAGGQYLFCGVSAQPTIRRAVLRFDVAAALPAGARVIAAELHLNCSRAGAQTTLRIDAHRLLAAFGEGTSVATGNEGGGAASTNGDATWLHSSYPNTLWTSSGGDFVATASASSQAPVTGATVWGSTAALVADVQRFLEQPASNFGWLLKSDEQLATEVRRFDSRENLVSANRPFLQVSFVAAGSSALVGSGCVGSNSQMLQLAVNGSIQHGQSFALQLQGGTPMNFGSHGLALGLSAAPLPLGVNCEFLLDTTFGVTFLGLLQFDGSGQATQNIAVPNIPTLFGFSVAAQAIGIDGGVPLGIIASNAAVVVVN